MGTRADFYEGRGPDAEWLGSIAWDGYPDGIPDEIKRATDAEIYRRAVDSFISERNDGTKPEMGWPWPWDDSRTTDFAYAYDGGQVWASCFGYEWHIVLDWDPDREDDVKSAVFPDMSERKNVTYGDRSGIMIISAPTKSDDDVED